MFNVMVVDDSQLVRTHLKEIFKKAGYNIIAEADDGDSAIEQLQNIKPDIITLDINMPKMNGFEVLKEIKKLHSNAKVIMCTAMNQNSFKQRSLKLGAQEYITKPLEPIKLLEICKRLTLDLN